MNKNRRPGYYSQFKQSEKWEHDRFDKSPQSDKKGEDTCPWS